MVCLGFDPLLPVLPLLLVIKFWDDRPYWKLLLQADELLLLGEERLSSPFLLLRLALLGLREFTYTLKRSEGSVLSFIV